MNDFNKSVKEVFDEKALKEFQCAEYVFMNDPTTENWKIVQDKLKKCEDRNVIKIAH